MNALVHLGNYNKNTIDWVDNKQQALISHSSAGWDVQGQDASRLSVCWGLVRACCLIHRCHLFSIFLNGRRARELSGTFFIRG